MNILLTFDYELYFGSPSGSAEKCILSPTGELMQIAEKHDARFSFFVDCGYLVKLREYMNEYPTLDNDYRKIIAQLRQLSASGHDLQLHIHPHWEDSSYNGKEWVFNTGRYKLSDFPAESIDRIVALYRKTLEEISGRQVFVNRAGGWCIQPFMETGRAMKDNGVWLDSTVFKGGYFFSGNYYYDFRNAPQDACWRFSDDPLKPSENGFFTELPITPLNVSPWFYWKLFLLGRINPRLHKPIGDGNPMPAPGYRKKLLTSFTVQPLSLDGYNARLLNRGLSETKNKKSTNHMVVIGHPKALSRFSLRALDKFIDKHKQEHRFITYSAWAEKYTGSFS